ncbi:MAG: hypothetical protein KAQ92_00030 [Candidatus Aenigmarchaeota archaeon]|nr:hypothetical protein [Candidatus Aenigmarchaeota archaeon]
MEIYQYHSGDASLTICSIEFENEPHGIGLNRGRWEILTNMAGMMPIIILPKEETNIKCAYYPTSDTLFDHEYPTTLVLHTIKKSVISADTTTYAPEDARINLIAKYTCNHYDGQFNEPEYGFSMPDSVYFEVLLDRLMKDIMRRMPWEEINLPKGAIRIIDITTKDPVILRIQIFDSNKNIVAEINSSLPVKYMSFLLDKRQSYNFIANSEIKGRMPVSYSKKNKNQRIVKTLIECKKSVLIPAVRLLMKKPISHAVLLTNRLFIATGRYLLIYDVGNLDKPVKLYSKRMKKNILSFDIAKGTKTKNKGYLMVCLEGSQISPLELLKSKADKPSIHMLKRQRLGINLKNPSKTIFYKSICAVIGTDGLRLFDIHNPEQFKHLSKIKVKAKVYDAIIKYNVLFIGTNKGIWVVDIKQPESPKTISIYKTGNPVTQLEIRGPFLYATKEKGGTIVLDYSSSKSLKQIGMYCKPLWKNNFHIDGDVGFSILDNKKQLELFSRQTIILDITKLKRFTKKIMKTSVL